MNENNGGERRFIMLFLSLIILAVLFLGGYYLYQKSQETNGETPDTTENETEDENTDENGEESEEVELNGEVSVVELIEDNENLEIISGMIADSQYAETLANEDERFTLFLPIDTAYAAVTLPNDPEAINELLGNYIVEGVYFADDLLEVENQTLMNLNGGEIKIEIGNGKFIVNGSEVLIVDLEGNNGVVFITDSVF